MLVALQVQEEIDEVLGDGDQPDVKGYAALKYLTRCVNESMRLFPHPPVLLRRAEIEDTLPGGALRRWPHQPLEPAIISPPDLVLL